MVLLSFIEFYRVLLSFTEFYLVYPQVIHLYWVSIQVCWVLCWLYLVLTNFS